jgi:hypothetical protein
MRSRYFPKGANRHREKAVAEPQAVLSVIKDHACLESAASGFLEYP